MNSPVFAVLTIFKNRIYLIKGTWLQNSRKNLPLPCLEMSPCHLVAEMSPLRDLFRKQVPPAVFLMKGLVEVVVLQWLVAMLLF
jgi:hypothetical protein